MASGIKVGLIGSGHIGSTLARLLTKSGYDICISNSRGPESLKGLVSELGSHATACSPPEAARFGDVIVVATPLAAIESLPAADLRGKIVVDANNYYPGRDGRIADLDGGLSSSEFLARHLPGVRVVKAFNTVYFEHLAKQAKPGAPHDDRRAVPYAGDDADAKATVARLIDSLGFAAVENGKTLADGRRQQPDTPVYNKSVGPAEAKRLLAEAE